jgi:hypothetical protein
MKAKARKTLALSTSVTPPPGLARRFASAKEKRTSYVALAKQQNIFRELGFLTHLVEKRLEVNYSSRSMPRDAIMPGEDSFCHRCRAADIYFLTDLDRRRTEEEYYEYQLRILAVDKSELDVLDERENPICPDCGHAMRVGDGNPMFRILP